MKTRIAAIAALALAAGSAHAGLFSFASDTTNNSWTFTGNGANVANGTGPTDFVTLNIDDNNGAQPTIAVSTVFVANYNLTYVASIPLGGGTFSHNYLGSGSFSFTDAAAGTTLLTINFTNALFTARGGQNSWFSTAALQGEDGNGGTVTMNWSGANLPAYGITPGVIGGGNFGFSHTALNSSGALPYSGQSPGRALGANMLPSGQWWSEASFSATNVPASGSIALLGLAGLVAARRRRA